MKVVSPTRLCSPPTRLKILGWLRAPEDNFPPHTEVEGFGQGVCVAFIQAKTELSQSVTSQYMSILHKADLVISTRIGKWTYYRRNEETIQQFADYVSKQLWALLNQGMNL